LSLQLGEHRVGVRVDDAGVLAALRDALGAWLVPADPSTTYSIHLGDDARAASHALAVVYRDGDLLVRTRSRERALRALGAHLASHLAAPDGAVRLRAIAAVSENGRAIVAPFPRHGASTFDRYLAARGLHVVDGPVAHIDVADASVVAAEPIFPIGAALAAVTTNIAEQPDEAPAAPGRYPIRAVVTPPLPSIAARVAFLASLVPPHDARRGIEGLHTLAASVLFPDDVDDTGAERAKRLARLV